MIIIGFGHQSGVGKDEAARFLKTAIGADKVAVRGFATTLKEAAGLVFNLSEEQMYGTLKEVEDSRYSVSPRHILQKFGNDLRELFWDSVWIDALVNKIPELEKQGYEYLFVTDVRYPNEAEALKKMGATLIKIERNSRKLPGNPNHSSETAMNDYSSWDYVINNDASLFDFHGNVLNVFEEITGSK